uniref:PseI/NeuA/B-like domain-containing protein n=1 Tax=Haptolina brevifila TaxID=156173 RepID=A0A7S2C4U6_9EUKA
MSEPASKKARTEPTTAGGIVYHEPKVMAEIGCNHMGSVEIAKELLTLAKQAGCDYGKFQKRNPKELLTKAQYEAPHPNPRNSYGDTYGAHREFLELSRDQHAELLAHCKEIGLGYSCSVWDATSAKDIVSLNPDLIKVGSPSNQHWEMQKILRDEYSGDVHISTGMTTKEEIEKIVKFWEEGKGDAKNRVVLYNCTSGYPVPFEDVCLLELRTLYDTYKDRVCILAQCCPSHAEGLLRFTLQDTPRAVLTCLLASLGRSSTSGSRATIWELQSTLPRMLWARRGTSATSPRIGLGRGRTMRRPLSPRA